MEAALAGDAELAETFLRLTAPASSNDIDDDERGGEEKKKLKSNEKKKQQQQAEGSENEEALKEWSERASMFHEACQAVKEQWEQEINGEMLQGAALELRRTIEDLEEIAAALPQCEEKRT
jgi:hypothetical protein